jgi:thiosulfate/3-mercaptopyruvate sulfurtransferase
MRNSLRVHILIFTVGAALLAAAGGAHTLAQPQSGTASTAASAVPAAAIMEPAELARILQASSGPSAANEKPLIFQVGFQFLYKQAHIPGSEYLGPASKDDGIVLLRHRVESLPRAKLIVLYCGCCPWSRCPNVQPAYAALRGMGFTSVKVLRLEENFGANWVSKGYPTVKAETKPE